jgi:VanZ family protein
VSPPAEHKRSSRDRVRQRLWLWLPVVLYMAGIFIASSMSKPPIPEQVSDVSLHSLAYCGLTLLLIRALSASQWSSVTPVTDEWHQSFVPHRQPDVRDVIANAIGALAATVMVGAWGIIRRL